MKAKKSVMVVVAAAALVVATAIPGAVFAWSGTGGACQGPNCAGGGNATGGSGGGAAASSSASNSHAQGGHGGSGGHASASIGDIDASTHINIEDRREFPLPTPAPNYDSMTPLPPNSNGPNYIPTKGMFPKSYVSAAEIAVYADGAGDIDYAGGGKTGAESGGGVCVLPMNPIGIDEDDYVVVGHDVAKTDDDETTSLHEAGGLMRRTLQKGGNVLVISGDGGVVNESAHFFIALLGGGSFANMASAASGNIIQFGVGPGYGKAWVNQYPYVQGIQLRVNMAENDLRKYCKSVWTSYHQMVKDAANAAVAKSTVQVINNLQLPPAPAPVVKERVVTKTKVIREPAPLPSKQLGKTALCDADELSKTQEDLDQCQSALAQEKEVHSF